MDTTIASPETSGAPAVTETPAQPTGTGDAGPENTQVEGGGSQDSTEGSQPQDQGRRKWSIQDEVKELRAQRRELRDRLGSFDQMREELAQLRESVTRQADSKAAKTPANFWLDPEATLDAKLTEKLERLQNSMFERFDTTRQQQEQQQALRQEQASATEFIRTQKGYSAQDDEDLIEIIEGIPNRQNLSPAWVAEYAWMKLQQSRGVGDRSSLKRQAAGVQGQPPGRGFGEKQWTKAEFENAVDMVAKNPTDPKHSDLIKELEAAHRDGRVR
jgi:hypothetical protein